MSIKKKRIALFGGSFDPVHTDHLNIAKACHDQLGFKEVWFIPTYLNPFKKDQNSSVSERMEMLNILAKKYKWIKINDFEIKKLKPSYTYKTVDHFVNAKEYAKYDFEFIMGSDQLDNFEQWDQFEKLIKLIKFNVFLRTDDYNKEVVNRYDLKVFNFDRIGLSSTMIRNLEKLEFQMPELNDYVNYKLIYADERIKNHLSKERYEHSLKVGQMAQELAKLNKVDETKAFVAGTLHDIAKDWSNEKTKKYLETWLPKLVDEPMPVWHSFVGMLHLRHDWMIRDEEILSAVFSHTVGKAQMSKLDKIVFCADKISKDRNYPGVKELRTLCLENLDKGFYVLLRNQYNQAIEKHGEKNIGSMIQTTYRYYILEGHQ